MQLSLYSLIIFVMGTVLISACTISNPKKEKIISDPHQPQPYVKLTHPEWSKNASIYQLNTRQFTHEGTFSAATKQLPRLKELGINIIWLMPIHPIGEKNRKGSLGSPYAIKDYYGVNPEFGTLADLKSFVNEAHRLGLYVIFDWVANHTAWDNLLQLRHPEWYARDYKGDLRPTPWWDWDDIIDLDYSQPAVREYMTDAMKYWVKEVNIDGYRCDVAGFVPIEFWENVRAELDKIKPVFMLAEWESRDLHARAFDMTYSWTWWDHMHRIAQGHADVSSLFVYYSWNESAFPKGGYRMIFVTNHDKNAWEATEFEAFGDGLEAAIVLSVVGEGMPLIYNGQEAGNTKRLAFFERDPIQWRAHPLGDLYKKLLALKKQNTALWNGSWGATMIRVPNTQPKQVFSFVRQNQNDKVFVVMNLSNKPQKVSFNEPAFRGVYRDYFSDEHIEHNDMTSLMLEPWAYRVYVRE